MYASDSTTTSSGSSSGEYVTVDVPLTWVLDRYINMETGQEVIDTNQTSGSVSSPVNIIPGATYSVSIGSPGSSYTTGVMAFYYQDLSYLGWQSLWTMSTGSKTVPLVIPGAASNFRLSTDTVTESNNNQNQINLSITVSATYLEENNLTEETLLDVVYADDSTVIDDATQKFTDEFENLHEQEDYLLEESKGALDDFFASFSWSDLEEYSSGFTFIGTWFSNLYNSHSAVALLCGIGAALTFLFVLLRFKGH